MATVRQSRILYVNNASSAAFPFPTGSAAGDDCFIFAGHGWNVNNPAGWTVLDNQAGSNFNGAVFYKNLTAADITAGSVTISFAGVFYGIIGGITFVGALGFTPTVIAVRSSSSLTSRTLTTSFFPGLPSGTQVVNFGSTRGNTTMGASGSPLQTTSNLNASGVLTLDTLASAGNANEVFTEAAAGSGDYDVSLILPATGSTTAATGQLVRQTLVSPVAKTNLYQGSRLTLLSPDTPVSVYQGSRLTLLSPDTPVSVYQAARLILRSSIGGTVAVTYGASRLSLIAAQGFVQASQVARLALLGTSTPIPPVGGTDPGFVSILW